MRFRVVIGSDRNRTAEIDVDAIASFPHRCILELRIDNAGKNSKDATAVAAASGPASTLEVELATSEPTWC